MQHAALAIAERHERPFTVAQARTFTAIVGVLDGDWLEVRRLATSVLDLADEYGFPLWRATALVLRGRALVEKGAQSEGLAEMREGLAMRQLTGHRLGDSLLLSFFVEACLLLAQADEGLAVADAGLAHCGDTGERVFESELWRLRGECIRRLTPTGRRARPARTPDAVQCLERAAEIARAQGARMLEQRAHASLPRAPEARRATR
jgi:hypothetical protein